MFVALTRPQMFAGVTYSLFHRQCGDRDRIVPDLPLDLGAGRGARHPCRRRAALPARAALLRPLAHPGRPLPARQATTRSGDATPIGPDPRRSEAVAREKPRRASPALCAACRRSYDRDPRRPADAGDPPARPAVRDRRHRRDQLSQAAARRDAAVDRLVALRPLPPHRPPPDRRRAVGRPSRRFLAPARRRLAGAAGDQAALRQRAVPDPDPPPAAGPGRRPRPAARHARPRRRRGRRRRRLRAAPARRRARRPDRRAGQLRAAAARRLPDAAGALLRAARIPLRALQWRDAARCCCRMQDLGAYLPYRRVSFGQETVELGPAGPTPAQLPRHRLDQGLSRPDRARHARRAAAAAVRADRLAELRLRRAAGGAGADEPRAAADALGRGRGGEPARRARPAPRTRSPPAAPASASIT